MTGGDLELANSGWVVPQSKVSCELAIADWQGMVLDGRDLRVLLVDN